MSPAAGLLTYVLVGLSFVVITSDRMWDSVRANGLDHWPAVVLIVLVGTFMWPLFLICAAYELLMENKR